MSGSVSYAAAVSTPTGRIQQPQIQARACSHDDLRTSFESPGKPQRPGAGIRSKTSFRGWSKRSEKGDRAASRYSPGPVHEVRSPGQFPRDEHRPNTASTETHVYVLTLKMTDSLARTMNKMRKDFFPKRLNRTPAHLTLFHALPHSQLEALEATLSEVTTSMQPFHVSTGSPFRMRKGVGVNVDGGYREMKDMHEQLQSQWRPFLSEQDAGGFKPHWTVMNKVDDEKKVDSTFNTIRSELSANHQEGEALGLDLWRYDRGNWEWAKDFSFRQPRKTVVKEQPSKTSSDNKERGLPMKNGLNEQPLGEPSKRPGMWKRGSSVGDALRTMSFRRKS